MKRNYHLLIWPALSIVVLDQISKYIVLTNIEIHRSIPVISGFFNLVHTRNRGMAFGIFNRPGSDLGYYLLLSATFVAVILLLFWFSRLKQEERILSPGLSLILGGAIGNLADRTVNFASLVMGGVMDACPDLKICLSHGGGYICHGIGRIDRSWETRIANQVNAKQAPSAYLDRFYYDCIVYTEKSLRFLIDTVGAERVVFGTDWPYDMALDWPVSWILSMESITDEEKELILSKNLENLLGI